MRASQIELKNDCAWVTLDPVGPRAWRENIDPSNTFCSLRIAVPTPSLRVAVPTPRGTTGGRERLRKAGTNRVM